MSKHRKPFEFKKFIIHQAEVSLPVTTDACLFGALTEFNNPQRILDMGCGSGLLMFMMHQKYPNAEILGIEKHLASAKTTLKNIHLNHVSHALKVEHSDWWEYTPDIPFDAIICNPPFFENQLASEEESKRNARHTNGYSLYSLLKHAMKWLKEDGEISCLIPYMSIEKIQQKWHSDTHETLYLNTFQSIQSKPNTPPHLLCIKGTKTPKELKFMEPHCVYNSNMKYTEESKRVLQPFLQDRAFNEGNS